jgi:hypothetical protein
MSAPTAPTAGTASGSLFASQRRSSELEAATDADQ